MTIRPWLDNQEQLLATAAELQTMADLIEKYPAEAQLIMAALEDGLKLGPMRVGGLAAITVSHCADADEVCRSDDCANPADLVIVMPDEAGDAPRRLWCLDHWVTFGDVIAASGVASFDPRARELIAARLGTDGLVGSAAEARHRAQPR